MTRTFTFLLTLAVLVLSVSCTSNTDGVVTEDQRKMIALDEIKKAYGKKEYEYSVTLFVDHHLAELKTEYWKELLGVTNPSPSEVLGTLILIEKWSSDEGEVYDFTLPKNVTDYVISVSFNKKAEIIEISMKS